MLKTLTTLTLSVSLLIGCAPSVPIKLNELNIPPLIDSRAAGHDIALTMAASEHEFYIGKKSPTMGFNGSYLGPTIRLYKGESTTLSFTNQLAQPTTVHAHGLHIAGHLDGGPHNKIASGDTWRVTLPIVQQASTNWYHPHLMGKTASQVHAGLAGLYLIDDQHAQSLELPSEYGVNDIPLVVQDRTFVNGIMKTYNPNMQDMMEGLREDTLVANGTVDAQLTLPQGYVRLRLLNGSNSRSYQFYLSNGDSFYKIATEGGLLTQPLAMTQLSMAPGERNEIILDLKKAQSLRLMARFLPAEGGWLATQLASKQTVVHIKVDDDKISAGKLPKTLNSIVNYQLKDVAVTRKFVLEMGLGEGGDEGDQLQAAMDMGHEAMSQLFSINGKSMSMQVINERVKLGDLELWEITAQGMDHPFHVHGTSFQIISHNGQEPAEEHRGWKDVVVVGEGITKVLMRFNHVATKQYPYMYHCHILEHEEGGMMGQFTVQ